LRLEDKAVHITVALRLGSELAVVAVWPRPLVLMGWSARKHPAVAVLCWARGAQAPKNLA